MTEDGREQAPADDTAPVVGRKPWSPPTCRLFHLRRSQNGQDTNADSNNFTS